MTVFKYFMKITFNYRSTILIYLAVFLMFTIISTKNASSQEHFEFENVQQRIGLVNKDDSQLAKELVDYLVREHNIVDMEYDEETIKQMIFLEEVDAVLVIPEDFEDKVLNKEESIEILRDDRKIGSYQIQNQVNKFIAFANASYSDGKFHFENVTRALDTSAKVNISGPNNGLDKDARAWFNGYYNFISYVIMAIYIYIIGMVMSDFNVKEVEARRKVSSIRLLKFNREVYLGQFVVAFIISTIFILASIAFGSNYISHVGFPKYVLSIGVFSLTVLCLVFLITNITTNKYAITAIANALSLGLSFISGVFVPQELLSNSVLNIAKFFPVYYYVSINNKDISSLLEIRFELSMLLLFSFAFLLVGIYLSRVKQRA